MAIARLHESAGRASPALERPTWTGSSLRRGAGRLRARRRPGADRRARRTRQPSFGTSRRPRTSTPIGRTTSSPVGDPTDRSRDRGLVRRRSGCRAADLAALPGVATVTAGEPRSLDARYVDTADAASPRGDRPAPAHRRAGCRLAHQGTAQWTVPAPAALGLGDSVADVPPGAVARAGTMTGSPCRRPHSCRSRASGTSASRPSPRRVRQHDGGVRRRSRRRDGRAHRDRTPAGVSGSWSSALRRRDPHTRSSPRRPPYAVRAVGGRPAASASKLARVSLGAWARTHQRRPRLRSGGAGSLRSRARPTDDARHCSEAHRAARQG